MKDMITSVAAISIGIAVYILSTPLDVSDAPFSSNPAIFPQLISIFIILLGFMLLINSLKSGAWSFEFKIKISSLKLGSLFLLFIVYLVGLQVLGFIISTLIFLWVMMYLLSNEKLLPILYSLALTTMLYMVFGFGFKILLPIGYFWS